MTSAEVERLILANARLAAQIRRNREEGGEILAVAQVTIDALREEIAELEKENLELNIRLGAVNRASDDMIG
ncbi:hypothetical protein [uncultured Mailhella sp.]|uniref:hypothetical protein n=1 Tax=uncultured Mailhella sp. TaxID=1981031 RepID=UPI0025D4415C|nr:hypothetical protein [uncultured Mailhella sp.]